MVHISTRCIQPITRRATDPAGIPEYKIFFYVILYVIILFDIEIDIKIRFIFCRNSVFMWFSMLHIEYYILANCFSYTVVISITFFILKKIVSSLDTDLLWETIATWFFLNMKNSWLLYNILYRLSAVQCVNPLNWVCTCTEPEVQVWGAANAHFCQTWTEPEVHDNFW